MRRGGRYFGNPGSLDSAFRTASKVGTTREVLGYTEPHGQVLDFTEGGCCWTVGLGAERKTEAASGVMAVYAATTDASFMGGGPKAPSRAWEALFRECGLIGRGAGTRLPGGDKGFRLFSHTCGWATKQYDMGVSAKVIHIS